GTGNAMGTLYVLGTVEVTATGGGAAGGAGGGGGGNYSNKRFFDGDWYYHNASGGGGGGGGGSTVTGSAIGGGSGGAGGGGGGGSGSRYSSRNTWWAHSGYGGNGGYGGNSGSAGTQESGCPTKGGYGGGGGSRGGTGNSGTLYKSAGASVNGRNADGVANTHSSVSSTITFNNQDGTPATTSTLTVSYGDYMPNVTVPTKEHHSFMGYYTEINGGGTRYIDHRGVGLRTFESVGATTLYAHWVQNQFNVTLDKQTGTGGTDSFITTGTDGTLPTITPPTKEYATFLGYHAEAAGGGTKYYDSAGTPVNGLKITANSVLYASWNQTQFRLTFGRQGGVGGTDFIYTNKVPNATAPAITPPTKQGAAFLGYFTNSTGGTQIYNADGTPFGSTTFDKDTMLYAQWNEATYNITYVLGGGTAAGAPTSRAYSSPTTIPAATKAGYTFLGWQVDNLDTVRHRDLTIPAFAKDYAKDITLTAIWAKGADTNVVVGGNVILATGNQEELKKDLADSFDTVVTEGNKGVTSSDLAGDKQIKLVLSVDKIVTPAPAPAQGRSAAPPTPPAPVTAPDTGTTTEPTPSPPSDQELIDSIAQGEVLSFYDISAVKEVTDGAKTTKTTLLEIPEPIAVKIPLTGDMAGKTSYRVYRVHDGKTELLPTGPTGKEYFSVEDGNVVIRTHKFSTYGVVGAQSQIDSPPGEIFERGGGNVDVQGRVLEGATTLVYKVDIAWGAMAFEYSLNKEWDPITHMYTEGALNAWRPASFDGINNRIRSINHSNGAVKLNLAVTQNNLKGVAMDLHAFNEVTSALAPSFILPPAPVNSLDKDLEPAVAYMFLSGPPEKAWIDANKAKFAKVGVITVTVEPNTI
ncbi:MAG: InlB B-repeat-containing protein, partial [Oscillospiraceae bacterium]